MNLKQRDIRITGWNDLSDDELRLLFHAVKAWERGELVNTSEDGMCYGRACGNCPAGKLNTVGFEKERMLCHVVRGVEDADYIDPETYDGSDEDSFQISISDALELIEYEMNKRFLKYMSDDALATTVARFNL